MRTKTTLELEKPIYDKLKSLALKEGKTLKKLMDEIILLGMKARASPKRKAFRWPGSADLRPRVDLSDKEAVEAAIDGERRRVLD